VKGVKAPPFALPDTFAEGMLSPNPSVSAAAELLKYAYSLTVPKKTGSTQEVVMFTVALPFETPLGSSAKLTNPGDAVIVMALLSVAFRVTPAAPEFNWALACEGMRARIAVRAALANPLLKILFLASCFRIDVDTLSLIR
jgi:hypothetical protein